MKVDDSFVKESTFLEEILEDPFKSLCKSTEVEWKMKKCASGNQVNRICVDP